MHETTINVKVSVSFKEKAKKSAREKDLTLSQLVRKLLRECIDSEQGE